VASYTEIRPLSTEISHHIKQVLKQVLTDRQMDNGRIAGHRASTHNASTVYCWQRHKTATDSYWQTESTVNFIAAVVVRYFVHPGWHWCWLNNSLYPIKLGRLVGNSSKPSPEFTCKHWSKRTNHDDELGQWPLELPTMIDSFQWNFLQTQEMEMHVYCK